MDSKIWKWLMRWFGLFSTVRGCTHAVPYALSHPIGLTAESVYGLKPQSRSFSMKFCLWNLKSYISAHPLGISPSGVAEGACAEPLANPSSCRSPWWAGATSLGITKLAGVAQRSRSITRLICQWWLNYLAPGILLLTQEGGMIDLKPPFSK